MPFPYDDFKLSIFGQTPLEDSFFEIQGGDLSCKWKQEKVNVIMLYIYIFINII